MIFMWTGVASLLLIITQSVFASDAAATNIVLSPAFSSFALFGASACAAVLSLVQKGYREVKPLLDRVLALLLLVVALPLMVIIAIVVKSTSPGPVFFKQIRVGENRRRSGGVHSGRDTYFVYRGTRIKSRRVVDHCGRLFRVYKFRTMYVDAESGTGPVWAVANDPRVTPVGRILRKTHLDELPQLFNVLRGNMSLVGPRPERPFFVKTLKDSVRGYSRRLEVKPGITGLAQVRHKYDETLDDVARKVAYDRLYVYRQCLLVDLAILFETVRVAIFPGIPWRRRHLRTAM